MVVSRLPGDDGLAGEAAALLDLANADPGAVLEQGPDLARRAREAGRHAPGAVCCRAIGLAAARLSDMRVALDWLERAHQLAGLAGDETLRATVDVTYAAVLSWSGDPRAALDLLGAALRVLDGVDRSRALAQRGQIRLRIGNFGPALDDLDAAERSLRDFGDHLWRARALTNRGLARTYVGSLDAAVGDLEAARAVYEDAGADSYVGETISNLGWVNAQRGDIVRALTYFDEAEGLLTRLGYPLGQLLRDKAEALIAANLTAEALAAAQRAADELRQTGLAAGYLEALATLARAGLAAGDHALAAQAGDELASAAKRQDRSALAWHGRYLAMEARQRSATEPAPPVRDAGVVATRLQACGLATPAMHAAMLVGELALDRGRPDEARRWLDLVPLTAGGAPLAVRVRLHLARARLHAASGSPTAVSRALNAGMAAVERYQATLGATETRAAVAGYGADLARMAMRVAVEGRRPRRLLAWMERSRASALRFHPARPPDDPDFAATMAQLRWAEARLQEEGDPRRVAELNRTRAGLEDELRSRVRRTAGAAARADRLDVRRLLDSLGDAALVMYGGIRGELHAALAYRGRVRHRPLGTVAEVRARLLRMRTALRRLEAMPARGSASRATQESAADDRRELDALLLGPLRLPEQAPLVIVPPPALFAAPWTLLTGARGRAVTVAPSAATWLACSGRPPGSRVLLVNGPRLVHGSFETRLLEPVYPGATRLTARTATVERVRREIGRCDVAHIAAHGRLRADNPQFSSLELADGLLNVFDLESVVRAPALIVLSSCDGGLTAELPGNEIMGLVASLLALGAGSVVAGVGLVPDARRTASFMRRFHERIAAGDRPPAALAATSATLDPGRPRDAALASFLCFGGS